MQPNHVQRSLYFYVFKGNKKVLNNVQLKQMLRSPPPSSRQAITIFTVLLCSFLKSLLVNAGNSLFSVMLKVLQDSWVLSLDFFFHKFQQKKSSGIRSGNFPHQTMWSLKK